MSFEPSRMDRSEASLLENTDAVVKLLNSFVLKDNISSQHVLRRLEYLYDRLSDFLGRELPEDWAPTEDKSFPLTNSNTMQQKEDDLSIAQTRHLTSVGTSSLVYECKLCKNPVTLYNSDTELSVNLHCQEAVHQRAVKMHEIKEIQAAVATLDVHSSKEENCQYLTNVTGSIHEKKLASSQMEYAQDENEIVSNENGEFWCIVCNVLLGSNRNAILHKRAKTHQQKLVTNLLLEKEDKFWLKIPEGWRIHRKYFVSRGDAVMHCKVCLIDVPKTHVNILSHIRGKAHSRSVPEEL